MRTFLDLEVQFGMESSLDDSLLERGTEQLLDTLDHASAGVLALTPNQANVPLDFGGVTEGRILYIEVEDGDIRFTLGGGLATHAVLVAAGAVYPTGFVGGETFDFKVDGLLISVVFAAGDQSLTQVINRINSFCALAGLTTPIAASQLGQLKLTSPTVGDTSTLEIIVGTAVIPLGFVVGVSAVGVNPTPATSPIELRRPADPAGSSAAAGVKAIFYATVKCSSVIVENLSDNVTRVRYGIAGDLVAAGPC